jgi:hypothetical protein
MDAGEAVGRKRRVVLWPEMHRADGNEQRERGKLDDHHDVVRARTLLRAAEQQPGDDHHDRECGNVDEYRNAGNVRRGIEQSVDVGIRAQRRGAIAGRQPLR